MDDKRREEDAEEDKPAEETGETRAGIGDLLGALMGAGGTPSAPQGNAGPDLGGIEGLLGAGGGGLPGIPDEDASPHSGGSPAGGADIGALLGGLMGGATGGSAPTQAPGGMDLGALLGGLMGGVQGGAGVQPSAGGLDIGALLGGLMGGGSSSQTPAGASGGPDIGGLLGGLLGGQQGTSGLAEQTGLGPAILQAAVPMILGALMKGGGGRAAGISDPAEDDIRALVAQSRSGAVPDLDTVRATAAPQQLATRAGIDVEAAAEALQKLLAALTGGGAKAKPKERPASSISKPKTSGSSNRKTASNANRPKAAPHKSRPKASGSTKPKTSGKRPTTGSKRSTGGG